MRFIVDPESQITSLVPNLMKLVNIDNPDQHIREEKFVDMFKLFIKYRDNIYNDQQLAFQKLQEVLLKLEKFDDRKGTDDAGSGPGFGFQNNNMAYTRRLSVVPMSAAQAKALREASQAKSLAAATSKPKAVQDLNHSSIIQWINDQSKIELVQQFADVLQWQYQDGLPAFKAKQYSRNLSMPQVVTNAIKAKLVALDFKVNTEKKIFQAHLKDQVRYAEAKVKFKLKAELLSLQKHSLLEQIDKQTQEENETEPSETGKAKSQTKRKNNVALSSDTVSAFAALRS